jgi:hypothetical protein
MSEQRSRPDFRRSLTRIFHSGVDAGWKGHGTQVWKPALHGAARSWLGLNDTLYVVLDTTFFIRVHLCPSVVKKIY